MSLHPEIAEAIGTAFGPQHTACTELKQDALIVRLANGIVLTVRYAAPDAYSLRWTRDEVEAGIDTAPLHPGLATFPNHLHDEDGAVRPDPITDPGASPAENVLLLIGALLAQPTLGGADAA